MSDRTRDESLVQGGRPAESGASKTDKSPRAVTVLDPLRPAVVVRRRVYDASLEQGASAPRAFTSVTQPPAFLATEDDENGPPSSINVARALRSLRADELQRVEELVRADEASEVEDDDDDEDQDEDEVSVASPAPPPVPAVPTLMLGKSISLSELADRMGVPSKELPATLVARGFYALTAKTVLPRDTARVIAEMYGWRVEEAPPELDEPAPVKSGTRSRIATKHSVGTTAKSKGKAKSATKAKPAKRRLAR